MKIRLKSDYLKFLSSYWFMAVIVFIVFFLFNFFFLIKSVNKEVDNYNTSILMFIKDNIDARIRQTEATAANLVSMPSIGRDFTTLEYILNNNLNGDKPYINNIITNLNSTKEQNGFYSCGILFFDQQMLVASEGVYASGELSGLDIDIKTLYGSLNSLSEKAVWNVSPSGKDIESEKGKIITCIAPVSSYNKITAAVIIKLSEEDFKKHLESINFKGVNQLMVVDKNCQVYASNTSNFSDKALNSLFVRKLFNVNDYKIIQFENASYTAFTIPVGNAGWKLISVVPENKYFKFVYYIKQAVFLFSILLLVVIAILARFFTNKLYNPIRVLADKAMKIANSDKKGEAEKANSIQIINSAFNSMKHEINELEASLEENKPTIRFSLLYNLVSSETEVFNLDKKLKLAGLNFNKKNFGIVIVKMDMELTDDSSFRDYILLKLEIIKEIEELQSQHDLEISCMNLDSYICVVVNFDKKDELPNLVEDIIQYINDRHELPLCTAVSSCSSGINSLCKLYKEAVLCLKYEFMNKNIVIYYEQVLNYEKHTGNIRSEYFSRLENDIKNDKASIVIESIVEIKKDLKSGGYADYYCHEITMEVFRIIINGYNSKNVKIDEVKKADMYVEFGKIKYLDDAFLWIESLIRSFSMQTSQFNNSRNTELIKSVRKYIEENYDQVLSLDQVSEKFFLSSAYFSRVFKEETGVNFIDYVVDCKLKKAREILLNENISVNDLAVRLGYSNTQYFIRIFKDKFGITPNKARKNNVVDEIMYNFDRM